MLYNYVNQFDLTFSNNESYRLHVYDAIKNWAVYI